MWPYFADYKILVAYILVFGHASQYTFRERKAFGI